VWLENCGATRLCLLRYAMGLECHRARTMGFYNSYYLPVKNDEKDKPEEGDCGQHEPYDQAILSRGCAEEDKNRQRPDAEMLDCISN